MLSFLKDSEGGGTKTEQGFLAVSTDEKQVRKTTYLLVGLSVFGLLVLCIMIKVSGSPANASAAVEEERIEMMIAKVVGVKSQMFMSLEKVLNKFHKFSDVPQVRKDELVKNPFRRERISGSLEIQGAGSAELKKMISRQKMVDQTEDLQVLSIMQTEMGNCAMIDEQILYEGDSVRGFKIFQIGDTFVKLGMEDPAKDLDTLAGIGEVELDPEQDVNSFGIYVILKLRQ